VLYVQRYNEHFFNLIFEFGTKSCLRAGVAQSVQCLTTNWTTRQPGFRSLQKHRFFTLVSVFRAALRPTQPPVQWVPGVLSLGIKRGLGVTLTTHPHLVPRSRMSRSHNSFPLVICMAVEGRLYFLGLLKVAFNVFILSRVSKTSNPFYITFKSKCVKCVPPIIASLNKVCAGN
jgi:hypothetical protein